MNSLSIAQLAACRGGGEPFRTDLGQFIGAHARSVVRRAPYCLLLTGTIAFFEALAYALEE
jgi:hypothetical protein